MYILGIESSCDETAIAVLKDGYEILSSIISSQIDIHKKFGGVVPEIAARAHLTNLVPVLEEALLTAKITIEDIDAIAVTQGPGLSNALIMGITFARSLSLNLKIPVIPVNHIYAHAHGAFLAFQNEPQLKALFPCLTVIISGGHTNLFYMKDEVSFELVSESLDDACGECFDKVAKLMGLSYPGGPIIEKIAQKGDPTEITLPKMMKNKSNLNFSYSGLKTAVAYSLRKEPQPLSEKTIQNYCASFQVTAFEQVLRKVSLALEKFKVSHVIFAGGVSVNKVLRKLANEKIATNVHFPSAKYCTDNGAMIAKLGWHLAQKNGLQSYTDNTTWDVFSRKPEKL